MKRYAVALLTALFITGSACAPSIAPPASAYSLQGDRTQYVNAAIERTVYLGIYASGSLLGHCSGTVLRQYNGKSYILTAAHCVIPDTSIKVFRSSDLHRTSPVEATVVVSDVDRDLALLSVDSVWRIPTRVARSVTLGGRVLAVGYPTQYGLGGASISVTDGLVATTLSDPNRGSLIRISAPIHGGSSGGGVWNERGELIGVVSFGIVIRIPGTEPAPIAGYWYAVSGLSQWLTAAGYGVLNG